MGNGEWGMGIPRRERGCGRSRPRPLSPTSVGVGGRGLGGLRAMVIGSSCPLAWGFPQIKACPMSLETCPFSFTSHRTAPRLSHWCIFPRNIFLFSFFASLPPCFSPCLFLCSLSPFSPCFSPFPFALYAVSLGYLAPERLRTNLYDLSGGEVSPLQGRTFATWTLTTCLLCFACARDPRQSGVYAATLASFLVALAHFSLELAVFRTMTWRTALPPFFFASVSSLWMAAGWTYYTRYAADGQAGLVEPTASEDTQPHAYSKDE